MARPKSSSINSAIVGTQEIERLNITMDVTGGVLVEVDQCVKDLCCVVEDIVERERRATLAHQVGQIDADRIILASQETGCQYAPVELLYGRQRRVGAALRGFWASRSKRRGRHVGRPASA